MAIYRITTVVPLIGGIPGDETAKCLALEGHALYNNVFICLY